MMGRIPGMGGKMPGAGQHFMLAIRQLADSKKIPVEQLDLENEVGATAGDIYHYLDGKNEVPIRDIRAQMELKGPLVMAAIGWLLREGKIELKVTQEAIKVKLK